MMINAAWNRRTDEKKVPRAKPRVQYGSSHAVDIYQAKQEEYLCQVFMEETERTNLNRNEDHETPEQRKYTSP